MQPVRIPDLAGEFAEIALDLALLPLQSSTHVMPVPRGSTGSYVTKVSLEITT